VETCFLPCQEPDNPTIHRNISIPTLAFRAFAGKYLQFTCFEAISILAALPVIANLVLKDSQIFTLSLQKKILIAP
jgi:hypothetical protein